jgi:excinuclease UvrABC nuclease subunit
MKNARLLAVAGRFGFNFGVADRQLRFFERSKPLLERFGAGFFRKVPKGPGVYVMCGHSGQILYVGQSANLRTRLGSYRSANPDHVSRRVIRLIHEVATLTWEECDTPALARLRENELLRLHRPKFNRMNVYPRAYWFLGLEVSADGLKFCRTSEANPGGRFFGAFKGAAIYGFASLLRLLWAAVHQATSPFDLPRQLLRAKPPMQFTVPMNEKPIGMDRNDLFDVIHSYLNGESPEIIGRLSAALGSLDHHSLFYRNLIRADIETLTSFFENGPKRNQRLKEENAIHDRLIPQEDLDDWIALSGYRRNGTVWNAGAVSAPSAVPLVRKEKRPRARS